MKVIGFDPSLSNLGYVVLDNSKVVEKGRLQTGTEDGLKVERFVAQAESVSQLISKHNVTHIATEAPYWQSFNTEVLFALQQFLHFAYWMNRCRVVLFAPLQVKSYACPGLKATEVMKRDMVEAARADLGMAENARLANDVADAYWIAKMGARWWSFHEKIITDEHLTERERELFLEKHTYTRGKKKGVTDYKGIAYRKNELYYLYDEIQKPTVTFLRGVHHGNSLNE